MKYTIENVKEYLNFNIDNIQNVQAEPWDYPEIEIKGAVIRFQRYFDFSHFLYCMKRQKDFGLELGTRNENKINLDDIQTNVAFDSYFNVITTRSASEKEEFDKDLIKYHRLNKAFWGEFIDTESLQINTKTANEICKFYPTITDGAEKSVVYLPENADYDETQLAYVKTDLRVDKSLEVAYVFIKSDDKLVYVEADKNDWIY